MFLIVLNGKMESARMRRKAPRPASALSVLILPKVGGTHASNIMRLEGKAMKCPKCNGSGHVTNKRYYKQGPSLSYELGIPPMLPCKECKGGGYVIGNINDIVDRLRCAANGVTITRGEAKEMLDAILK